jgi:hypothetical protein
MPAERCSYPLSSDRNGLRSGPELSRAKQFLQKVPHDRRLHNLFDTAFFVAARADTGELEVRVPDELFVVAFPPRWRTAETQWMLANRMLVSTRWTSSDSRLLISLLRYQDKRSRAGPNLRRCLTQMSLNSLQRQTGLSSHTILRAPRGEKVHPGSLRLLRMASRKVPVRKR